MQPRLTEPENQLDTVNAPFGVDVAYHGDDMTLTGEQEQSLGAIDCSNDAIAVFFKYQPSRLLCFQIVLDQQDGPAIRPHKSPPHVCVAE
jgi:hypothetical protein